MIRLIDVTCKFCGAKHPYAYFTRTRFGEPYIFCTKCKRIEYLKKK